MRRRDFIATLGGAAAMPFVAFAQEKMRHIGVLTGVSEGRTQARFDAFQQGLAQLGWINGHNIRLDYRWGEGSAAILRERATELASLRPDVVLVTGGASMATMAQATSIVPIVFVIVPDPVGSGFVDSLSRPGGNATGFMQFEYSLSAKWLELLKEVAPKVSRVGVLWDPSIAAGIGQFAVIQSVAPSLGVEVFPINLRTDSQIERFVGTFARPGNSGLISTASALTAFHREQTVQLASRYGLPAVYSAREFVESGGLISYAADFLEQYRSAAGYVDRILRGEKPADLPVQAPTKYELVLNLKTAKALGLTLPPSVLARADEVIE